MLNILKTIFLGIVEGITEWLPISSTGHLILLNEFISLDVSESFFSMFEVVIQLGAILAVVLLFWNEIWPFSTKEKNYIRQDTFIMWFKIVVACIPAAVVEILFGDVIEELFYNYIVIAFALILFGIAFIIIESKNKKKIYNKRTLHPRSSSCFIEDINANKWGEPQNERLEICVPQVVPKGSAVSCLPAQLCLKSTSTPWCQHCRTVP